MQSKTCWTLSKKTKYLFSSDSTKTKLKFIKGSIFSILIGFIVSGIFLSFLRINPFTYFGLLFGINFDKNFYQISLNWMAVYIVAGLSMAIAFKSGVFNIGAPGQILAATSVSTIVFFAIAGNNASSVSPLMIILMLIVCVISAAFVAFIAGILKALFNIHEVVSTILLNWSVFYIFKWVFGQFKDFSSSLSYTSKNIPSDQLSIGSNTVVIPLLIALVCVVVIWVLFSKTVLGFKLKAVGSSLTGSKYIGINVKRQIITSLTLSGAVAGIAGFISMFTVAPNNFFASNSLPTLGFDAIAVSLVAFNNPIGIIVIGWLWAIIKTGGGPISSLYSISTQISGLISGILIYFTAIVSVFIAFKPWELLKNKYYLYTSKVNKQIVWKLQLYAFKLKLKKIFLIFTKDYKQQVNDKYENYITQNQVTNKISKPHLFWNGRKNIKLELKKDIKQSIITIQTKIQEIKKFINQDKTTLNVNGLKTHLNKQVNQLGSNYIQTLRELDLELADHKYKIKQASSNILNKYQTNIKKIKDAHKLRIQEIKMFKESEIGILTYKFDSHNHIIEIKANKLKTVAQLKEQIKNIKSDIKLDKQISSLNQTSNNINHSEQLEKIKQLKEQIKTIKKQANAKILEQKAKYKEQKTLARQEQTKLQAILDQYNTYWAEEQQNFSQAKKDALVLKQKHLELIDMNHSQDDVNKAVVLLNDLKTLIKDNLDLNLNKQAIQSNKQTLNKALEISSKIDDIFTTNIISVYDAPEHIKQKSKISLTCFKLITNLKKEIAYVTTRAEEQELISDYKNRITKAKQIVNDDKTNYQEQINKAPKKTLSDLEQLFNLEKSLKEQTNLKILNLENTMLKEVK
ncbi:ribose/galactose ABC transporter permease [Mycoplasma feriruminatoris]|uniref:ABC transporter permease subunit n=1 Tax=Mycoplasma feriruminatoris TaxID=1179777 RepID=UPI00241D79CF|nr:ABC transporter permease [Mycoplasma feriruminatoris]WFQ95608.1 ribose/galactose ABC transporter permease [Mycoplasma feriruminatoris]